MIVERDRVYLVTLVLTLVAICAFGVFIIRDYQDQGQQRVSALSGTAAGTGLVSTGSGAAPLATPGAGGTPAAASSVTTTTGGGGTAARPGSTGGRGSQVQACQGGVIRLGQIVPVTGPVTQQTAADATTAYFKNVNANGGINGCQVSFTYKDDGGLNNQQAAADARELVQEDQVFALVGNVQPVTMATTAQYFQQQGVPVVGVDGVGVSEYNNPVIYSFAESPPGFGISTADYAKQQGCLKLAVFYLDFDFGHASFDALQKQASANGQNVVYSNAEQISSSSYNTDTLQAKDANPDCLINILDANSVVREMNAMNQNSWWPNLVATTSSSDPVVNQQEQGWLGHAGHTVWVQRNYQPADAAIPEVQEWISIEGRYFPGFDPNSYAEGAWLGAKVFTDAARRLGPSFTRGDLLAALNALRAYHTGFTPDVTMTPDHGPNRQVIWLKWDPSRTKYAPISGFVPW